MTPDEIVSELEGYRRELADILGRFTRNRNGIHIDLDDNYRVRSITTELIDLMNDHVPGSALHRHLAATYYNEGISNMSESSSYASVKEIGDLVSAVLKRIERDPSIFQPKPKEISETATQEDLLDCLENLLLKFHAVAVQLRKRYSERETLDVGDEYDVQDLLHALLRLHFNDVRPEEWNPSYAGGSSRTDFLLPQIDTFVEVKMSRKGLNAKTLGEQLIIDIDKYQSHPQCRRLICFVYDPDGRISNPAGIENDLMGRERDIDVRVLILPKAAE